MSEYLAVKAEYRDPDLLLAAVEAVCQEMGVRPEICAAGEERHLFGYLGDRREQTAGIIVRRNYLDNASNDMGWHRRPDGSYELIISEFDNHDNMRARQIAAAVDLAYQERWITRLVQQNPAFHGCTVERNVTEQGAVELRLVNVHIGG